MKRILAAAISVVLVATMAIGGSIAYLQDSDSAVNVMTMGSVFIEQIEQKRVNDTDKQTELEEFSSGIKLYPAHYTDSSIPWAPENDWVQAGNQAWKVVADNENVVDKFVTVKNTGKSDAYVRTIFAIEVGPEAVNDKFVHVVNNAENVTKADPEAATWSWEWLDGVAEIAGTYYALAVATYTDTLAPGETTIPSLKQVYMDKTATNADVEKYGDTVEILVFSQAVQAKGFEAFGTTPLERAEYALEEAFYEITNTKHPWDGVKDLSIPTYVSSAKGLAEALAKGGNIILTEDIEVSETLEVAADATVVLDLNGNEISGSFAKGDGAVIENEGTMTIKDGALMNDAVNGDSVISNSGTMILDGAEITGAPIADGGYPAYAVYTTGELTVEEGTKITSDRGVINMEDGAEVVLNGGDFEVTDTLGTRIMTVHVIAAKSGTDLTINDGNFAMKYNPGSDTGASVICPWGGTIEVYGGNFSYEGVVSQGAVFQNYMGAGSSVNVYGGTFSDASVKKNVAEGYVAIPKNGSYTVVAGEEGKIQSAADSTALSNAIVSGAETVVLAKNGNYTMPEPDLRGKSLTIIGTKDTVLDMTAVDARDQFVTGADLVFDGVTLNFGKTNYMGLANTNSLTYKNCKINGLQFLFGKNVVFENCDLNSNGAEHCVWTYGVKNVSFIGCDFTYGDRGINCYSDNDVEGGKQTVNFTDCTFATENTASAGAVEINSTYFSVGIEVNMEGCTAPAHGEMAYVSPWDSSNGAKTTINIK